MRWYDVPMTWADGWRLMAVIVICDSISNGVLAAYFPGLLGQ